MLVRFIWQQLPALSRNGFDVWTKTVKLWVVELKQWAERHQSTVQNEVLIFTGGFIIAFIITYCHMIHCKFKNMDPCFAELIFWARMCSFNSYSLSLLKHLSTVSPTVSGSSPSSWTSQWMIYVAVLLCDLKIRPIHTAPVTVPLPACLLKTKPSVQNGNFPPT